MAYLFGFWDPVIFNLYCGRQTQYVKHARLKITKTVCPNASLPPDRWLTSPGRMVATSRLDDLFRQTQTQLNRNIHDLAWNRKSGKDAADASTFGLLYCGAAVRGRGCAGIRLSRTPFAIRHLHSPLPRPGFHARSPRSTTNRLPAARAAVLLHKPP